ncbi:hypothetical protein ACFWSF_28315 [Streptomyces sp. NPDC058611]|uniref:hypothetical protein n=1 Tax=Streptomyces sp. NPDC058611 TaxID=3346554 RepID=UPI003647FC18
MALTAGTATAQGVWITVPSMPAAPSALGGATANCPEGLQGKCVYAVPGTGIPADLAAYSPAVNTWATLPAVKPPPRYVFRGPAMGPLASGPGMTVSPLSNE